MSKASDLIHNVGDAAVRLDAWLREHLGRPYNTILGIGLVLGILDSLHSLGDSVGSLNLFKVAFTVAFQGALLVNQIGQFHEFRLERIAKRDVLFMGKEKGEGPDA